MGLLQILSDHSIEHTSEHHHCSPGWVQVHCPFCPGKRNFHMGIKLDGKGANCWRCGGHDSSVVLSTLLRISRRDAKRLLGLTSLVVFQPKRSPRDRPSSLKLPYHDKELSVIHQRYLLSRNFEPDQIEQVYGVVGTGPLGGYKWRLVIPIYREGKLISYMGRDVSGKSETRYKNCPDVKQIFPAKHWLYDLDRCKDRERILVVEGPTDVWRMGVGAVATMGITWTWEQATLLSKFNTVFICFDPEEQAQEQARKLGEVLSLAGVDAEVIALDPGEKDPGSLSRERVLSLRRWLGL
jgi:hypothetical protein